MLPSLLMSSRREWGLSGTWEREEKEVGAVAVGEKMEGVGEKRRRRAWKDKFLRRFAFMAVLCLCSSYVAKSRNPTRVDNG